MSIILNNGVTNVNGTPGINSDIFANRPAATDTPAGSIYIATDTGTIYQSNGATWSTIGGGGGPTPGIDSVLAVGQPLSATRQIDFNNNQLNCDNVGNFLMRTSAFQILRFTAGSDTFIGNNSRGISISNNGIIQGISGVTSVAFQCDIINNTFKFGKIGSAGNSTRLEVLDVSQQIFFTNKGTTNGVYCDFNNKIYLYGRLNSGSEQNIEIDEVNIWTRTKYAGIVNGFNLDFSANVFQFGFLDTATSSDTYINVNGNNNTIQAVYNGNDNGLNINFAAGSRIFQLGDYQNGFNGSKITIDDQNTSILISSNQSAGSTTIEGNQLIFTGANLQSNSSGGISGEHLVITLNGTPYKIELRNP